MRVKNPSFVKSETVEQSEITKKEAGLKAWFLANNDKEYVSFDQIRLKYKKTPEQWPNGMIHQKLLDWGFEVVDS